METKTFEIEEIEDACRKYRMCVFEAMESAKFRKTVEFADKAEPIIRQLLAEVKRAREVEEDIRNCVIFRSGYKSPHIAFDSDGEIDMCWYYNEDGKLPQRMPSFSAALSSLLGKENGK